MPTQISKSVDIAVVKLTIKLMTACPYSYMSQYMLQVATESGSWASQAWTWD